MSEISEYQVVRDAEQLTEPSGAQAMNGVHHDSRASERNGARIEDLTDDGPTAAASPPDAPQRHRDSSRLDTWGPNIPALRLASASALDLAAGGAPTTAPASAPATPVSDLTSSPPRLLRAVRFVVGVLLLVGAWAASVAVFLLARNLVDGFPSGMALTLEVMLYVLSAIGALWLALVALACLAAGAFALSLAFTARGW